MNIIELNQQEINFVNGGVECNCVKVNNHVENMKWWGEQIGMVFSCGITYFFPRSSSWAGIFGWFAISSVLGAAFGWGGGMAGAYLSPFIPGKYQPKDKEAL